MAIRKNGIVVLGAVFVDIKGFPEDIYIPDGRKAGTWWRTLPILSCVPHFLVL